MRNEVGDKQKALFVFVVKFEMAQLGLFSLQINIVKL